MTFLTVRCNSRIDGALNLENESHRFGFSRDSASQEYGFPSLRPSGVEQLPDLSTTSNA
jgi:hypothetical protein